MRTETNLQTGEVTQLEDAPITMPPAPTKQEIIDSISAALQNVLDTEAQKLGYDNIVTAVSYVGESAVPSFQTDGISFRAWRSNVWEYFNQVTDVADMQSLEEIMKNMPKRL